jgi:8-oxo-dGTP diphosphatase
MSKPHVHVAVAIVRRGKNWLVAKRYTDAHLGGRWEFPGGKINAGESPADSAVRELREECALHAEPRHTLAPVHFEYADRIVHITPVICAWTSGEPAPLANQACAWVSTPHLRRLRMPPANTEIIQNVLGFLEVEYPP